MSEALRKNVVIMLCCFNRKNKTKECLDSLIQQINLDENINYDILVYDDRSTDGTAEMIRNEYSQVTLLEGKGNAYWCKSMYCLMKDAVQKQYDYYLMVNDDVRFYHNALQIMFSSYEQVGGLCGIVGSCKSGITGEHTYGGRNEKKELIAPSARLSQCSVAGWNCFLVDKEVVRKVGIIDGRYQHAFGDYDYSFRMLKKNIPIYVASDYVGECEINAKKGTFGDSSLSRRVRFKKLFSPKGLPFYSYLRYNIKTDGLRGLVISIVGYVSFIYYIVIGRDF